MSHQQDRGRIVNVEPSNSFQGFESTRRKRSARKTSSSSARAFRLQAAA